MNTTQLLLIDLSAIAHQLFHVSGNEPDPNFISTKLIERVRGLATEHPHAAVCCDSGKSFRKDLDPTYKAQRDTENRGVIKHQMTLACERLAADGFPVWASSGYEADDIIATATREALAMDPDVSVLIASADKDLLQLVNGRVTMKKTTDGNVMDAEAVITKFGVTPQQMTDYLCLVGDTSDNVKGANGIGGVKASALLKAHGSLQAVYDAMAKGVVNGITPALRTSLMEFRERWPLVKSLIELKSDAPIAFAEIAVERTAPPMPDEPPMSAEEVAEMLPSLPTEPVKPMDSVAQTGERASAAGAPAVANAAHAGEVAGSIPAAVLPTAQEMWQRTQAPIVPMPAPLPRAELVPRDYSQELEPRNMDEAVKLAQRMFESRLFSAYGTPQAVLATVLAGRELGLPAMASLRAFHVIEGKPQLSAGAIVSLVLKSGKATYFRCTERTDVRVTYCTKRGDDPEMCLSYTIEEGKQAWSKDEAAWKKSGWGRNPADMLVARASSKLARLVYPDVVSGLYAPEETE